MKFLLFGAGGQLGREVVSSGSEHDAEVVAIRHTDVDITVLSEVKTAIAADHFDCVINAAAYTAVDAAEENQKLADLVNRIGAANVAKASREHRVPLIHLSTDYVFDGESEKPYSINDQVNPINVYGRTKEAGEREVRNCLDEHIILRTSWIYGIHGGNFVKTMLSLGPKRKEIQVVDDQYGCPTSARDLAEAVLEIAKQSTVRSQAIKWGTYHYSGEGRTNWCEYAKFVFKTSAPILGSLPSVTCIPSTAYAQAAQRPKDSVLDCTCTTEQFGIHQKPWRASVENIIAELLRKHPGEIRL